MGGNRGLFPTYSRLLQNYARFIRAIVVIAEHLLISIAVKCDHIAIAQSKHKRSSIDAYVHRTNGNTTKIDVCTDGMLLLLLFLFARTEDFERFRCVPIGHWSGC